MNRESSHGGKLIRAAGFTLIELLVVVANKGSYPLWNWGLPQQRIEQAGITKKMSLLRKWPNKFTSLHAGMTSLFHQENHCPCASEFFY